MNLIETIRNFIFQYPTKLVENAKQVAQGQKHTESVIDAYITVFAGCLAFIITAVICIFFARVYFWLAYKAIKGCNKLLDKLQNKGAR